MKSLAVYNLKGGVGKTAASVNLSYLASCENIQTLLMDLDPQGATSYYLRIKPAKQINSKKIFKKKSNLIDRNIKGTDFEGFDLLPASMSFRNFDIELGNMKKSENRLKKVTQPLRKQYDLILFDCPPNVTLLSENIFRAADYILVPLIPTTLSLLSYKKLIVFFEEFGLDTKKILPFFSMVERRKKLHKQIMDEGEITNLLHTFIPYNTDIEKMGIYRNPVCSYNPSSPGTKAFVELWGEVRKIIF
ncbi:MAG: AAA family ATPase [Victivallales bacterium]|nr:AAA family ATPase [Victivallales bacterium]